jgi:hypothetical protein
MFHAETRARACDSRRINARESRSGISISSCFIAISGGFVAI